MKTALGIFGIFVSTVFFLSIQIKDKPIFGHIYYFISPATKTAQRATEDFFGTSVNKTKDYSRQLFDNSVPRMKDSVKSKMSSRGKVKDGEPAERITKEEKEELDSLIKSHR